MDRRAARCDFAQAARTFARNFSTSLLRRTLSVDSPAKMTIVKKTVATGKVIPRREIEVKSQVSGVVEKLYVVAGQTVKKGAIIARISLRPNMINVASAEAQLLQARINLQNQAADMQRYQKLLGDRVISESQFRQYETNYNLQKEAVASAEKDFLTELAKQKALQAR